MSSRSSFPLNEVVENRFTTLRIGGEGNLINVAKAFQRLNIFIGRMFEGGSLKKITPPIFGGNHCSDGLIAPDRSQCDFLREDKACFF